MPDIPNEWGGYSLESGSVGWGRRAGGDVEILRGGLDGPSTLGVCEDPLLVFTTVIRVANDYDARQTSIHG